MADVEPARYEHFQIFRRADGSLIAHEYLNGEIWQFVSTDYGQSWQGPDIFKTPFKPDVPALARGQFYGAFHHQKVANGGQLYFWRTKNGQWLRSRRIRETTWGDFAVQGFGVDAAGHFYCIWLDWRAGNPDIYLSASTDSGHTWGSNRLINDDLSGQLQSHVQMVSEGEGNLFVFWHDNRDPQTLFDIYFSASLDGGATWQKNRRVNDDTTYAFQITPSAVGDSSGRIYVAWLDYRDKRPAGDPIANVYFSRSQDGGRTWSRNIALTQSRFGHNFQPQLSIETDGSLHCLWIATEENPRGDLYYCRSLDKGETWSSPVRVNDSVEQSSLRHLGLGWLGRDTGGTGYVAWLDRRTGQPQIYFARTRTRPDPTRPVRPRKQPLADPPPGKPIRYQTLQTAFRDDFSAGASSKWHPRSGTWICQNGVYIGYGESWSLNIIETLPLGNVAFQGEFLLDRLNHQVAIVYFGITGERKEPEKFYRLINQFRSGVLLEYFDGRQFQLLANAIYPFQSNRWYAFRAVVKNRQLNYFVNDSLLVSSDRLAHPGPLGGKVGIGAGFAPTYFKNIQMEKIE